MALSTAILSGRRNAQAFWLGSALVTIGVVLHLPMDPLMYWGMALIVGGIGFAAYGLLPKSLAAMSGDSGWLDMAPPEDAPLTPSHYSAWSTKWSLVTMIGVTALANPMLPLTLVIVGSCGAISILLPYTAENYPLRVRGRATGWIAGCSKLGGLLAQGLSVAGVIPAFATAVLVIAVPASTCANSIVPGAWPAPSESAAQPDSSAQASRVRVPRRSRHAPSKSEYSRLTAGGAT